MDDHEEKHRRIWEDAEIMRQEGLPVIPVCSHDHRGMSEKHRRTCQRPGKAPLLPGWNEKTCTTSEELSNWQKKYPDANFGVVTGSAAGSVGIDVDGPGGQTVLEEWSCGDLPPTWEFYTGAGRRYLYAWPPDRPAPSIRKVVGPHEGCEILGDGKQTVFPPSIHASGTSYEWVPDRSPWDLPPAPAPQWLLELRPDAAQTITGNGDSEEPGPEQLQVLAAQCPEFATAWEVQKTTGLHEETWFLWATVLTRAGAVEAAYEFSQASSKHDSRSGERLRELRQSQDEFGPARCVKFGCDQTRIAKCFGANARHNSSPAHHLVQLAEQVPENPSEVANEALKRVAEGDMGAHLTDRALDAFAALEQRDPPGFARCKETLRRVGAPLREFNRLLGKRRRRVRPEGDPDPLNETGILYNADGKVSTFNENVLARYLLERVDLGLTPDERFYLYEHGVWRSQELLKVQKLLRDIVNSIEPDFWREVREQRYLGALKREAPLIVETDQQTGRLNLANGMLSLDTFELGPHRKQDYSTVQVGISYDPEARCDAFLKFLNEVSENDSQWVRVVQEMFGYCLTAETKAQKAFLLYGTGSNGKSVLLRVLESLVGEENRSALSLADFESGFMRHLLVSKTVNISTENEVDSRGLNTQYLKAVVTGDSIPVDVKYGMGFTYRPIAKLVMAVNNFPYTKDRSHGLLRRLLIIPFRRKFSEKEADKELDSKLLAELPGILNWAIRGLRRLRENGYRFSEAASVNAANDEFRQHLSAVYEFVSDCFEASRGLMVSRKDIRETFSKWCNATNHQTAGNMTVKRFWSEFRSVLDDMGIAYHETKTNGLDRVSGIGVRVEVGRLLDSESELEWGSITEVRRLKLTSIAPARDGGLRKDLGLDPAETASPETEE